MILKKLEIYGFKSFGKKAVIDFSDKVTAIVGPNGSGKSNITDAMRWVMGEQRVKSLRGSKMEDVIFAGTDKKQPLGYAQVTLTLDNSTGIFASDYEEIEVMRRYYRSGDSEYYINKVQCRLKDVQTLFMDTGLGREGYSVVSQGQIDSIVVSSPAERKLLIEEAAGIVKYRIRKTEAEKKLEKAQNNLYRVTDIIAELESRLPSLKKQSEKAEKFVQLRTQLKEVEVGIFVHRMDKLNERIRKSNFDKKSIEESLKDLEAEMSVLDDKYRYLKSKISEYDGNIFSANNEIKDLMEQYEFAKVDLKVSEAKLEELEGKRRKTSLEESDRDSVLEALLKEKSETESALNSQRSELLAETERLNAYKNKTESILRIIRENESKLGILEGFENSMQGYKYAIRELMKLKSSNPVLSSGLYTTVGEIITTAPQYAEAISKSLGASLSYMITEDEKVAAECINVLKRNKWGRVTFLPKNIVKGSVYENRELSRCEGFIGYASSLVKTDPKFYGIINDLLARVAICDSLENANKAAAVTGHKLKIVTLDGEVLYPGGAVAGGRTKSDEDDSIKRKSEIEKLKKLISEAHREYDEIISQGEKPDENAVLKIRESVATLNERSRNISDRIVYFNEQKKKKSEDAADTERRITELKEKIKSYSNADEEYNLKRSSAEKRYASLVEEKERSNAEYIKVNDSIIQKSKDKNTVSEKLSAVELELSKAETEAEHLQENMMEDYGLTYASAIPYKTEISDLQSKIDEVAELKDKIRKLGNINVEALEEYKEVKSRYDEMCYQRDDLLSSKEELNKVLADISDGMEKRFMQQFQIIQKEFNNVFVKLFNGGEANLVLTDPNDILNSGVEIMARPPKTKLKNIVALSGGEMSMTAVSLIFAILRIKPSPFCVLDEIDAALDDANVMRICDYLRSIWDSNQFIIVTHKKLTMEIADTLYGVSKGSDGVSQILSVKFSDIDKYAENDNERQN